MARVRGARPLRSRVRDGEPVALAALCNRWGRPLFAYCEHAASRGQGVVAASRALGQFRSAGAELCGAGPRDAEAQLRRITRRAAIACDASPAVRRSPATPPRPRRLRTVRGRAMSGSWRRARRARRGRALAGGCADARRPRLGVHGLLCAAAPARGRRARVRAPSPRTAPAGRPRGDRAGARVRGPATPTRRRTERRAQRRPASVCADGGRRSTTAPRSARLSPTSRADRPSTSGRAPRRSSSGRRSRERACGRDPISRRVRDARSAVGGPPASAAGARRSW